MRLTVSCQVVTAADMGEMCVEEEIFEANMDAVILRQSVQWRIKVLRRPGPWVGNASCAAPQ